MTVKAIQEEQSSGRAYCDEALARVTSNLANPHPNPTPNPNPNPNPNPDEALARVTSNLSSAGDRIENVAKEPSPSPSP